MPNLVGKESRYQTRTGKIKLINLYLPTSNIAIPNLGGDLLKDKNINSECKESEEVLKLLQVFNLKIFQ